MATDSQRMGFVWVVRWGARFPSQMAQIGSQCGGEKKFGSSRCRDEDGRNRPLAKRQDSRHTGQCADSWGATSHMWQK